MVSRSAGTVNGSTQKTHRGPIPTRVSSAAKMVLNLIYRLSRKDGWSYMRQRTMAKVLGLDVSSAKRHIRTLKFKGLIEVQNRQWRMVHVNYCRLTAAGIALLFPAKNAGTKGSHLPPCPPSETDNLPPTKGSHLPPTKGSHLPPYTPRVYSKDPTGLDGTLLGKSGSKRSAAAAPDAGKKVTGTNGHGPVAAAASFIFEEEKQASKPASPKPAMGACPEAEGLVQELLKRGAPGPLARRLAVEDPALVQAVIGYFDAELGAGRFRNPPGAIRSMLDRPESWVFVKTASGWQAPPPRISEITFGEKAARMAAQRTAARYDPERDLDLNGDPSRFTEIGFPEREQMAAQRTAARYDPERDLDLNGDPSRFTEIGFPEREQMAAQRTAARYDPERDLDLSEDPGRFAEIGAASAKANAAKVWFPKDNEEAAHFTVDQSGQYAPIPCNCPNCQKPACIADRRNKRCATDDEHNAKFCGNPSCRAPQCVAVRRSRVEKVAISEATPPKKRCLTEEETDHGTWNPQDGSFTPNTHACRKRSCQRPECVAARQPQPPTAEELDRMRRGLPPRPEPSEKTA